MQEYSDDQTHDTAWEVQAGVEALGVLDLDGPSKY